MVNGVLTEVDKWGNPIKLDKQGQPAPVGYTEPSQAASTGVGGMSMVPQAGGITGGFKPTIRAKSGTYEDYNTDKSKDDLMYNPLQVVVGPNGERTTQLRKEFQARGGSSDLAQMLQEAGQQEAFGRDDAVMKAQMAADQARASSSMRGGIRGGNSALTQRASLRDMLMAQQGVSGQAMQNRNNLQSKARDVDTANASALYGAVGDVNKFYLAKRAQDKQVAAAKMNAQATRDANSGGSWVCTKVHEKNPLTKKDALALFKLRRFALKNKEEISRQYLYECKELVDKMVEAGEDFSNEENFVRQTINLVQEGKIEDAFNYYTKEILARIEKFWPECTLSIYTNNIGGI